MVDSEPEFLSPRGDLRPMQRPKIIVADTDDQAVEAAAPLVDGHDVEI
jgi:hypothetical protein